MNEDAVDLETHCCSFSNKMPGEIITGLDAFLTKEFSYPARRGIKRKNFIKHRFCLVSEHPVVVR